MPLFFACLRVSGDLLRQEDDKPGPVFPAPGCSYALLAATGSSSYNGDTPLGGTTERKGGYP